MNINQILMILYKEKRVGLLIPILSEKSAHKAPLPREMV